MPNSKIAQRKNGVKYVQPSLSEKPLAVLANGKKIWALNDKGKPICNSLKRGAVVKGTGARCQSTLVMENGRCKLHGGKSIKGPEHWKFAGGRFSGLPKSMSQKLAALMENPDITSLRADIALNDLRIEELLDELGGLNPDAVAMMKESAINAKMLLEGGYTEEDLVTQLTELTQLVFDVAGRERNWREVQSAQEHRRKLAETEQKKVFAEQTQIPVELLIAALSAVVRDITAALIDMPEKRIALLSTIRATLHKFFPRAIPADVPRTVADVRAQLAEKAGQDAHGPGDEPDADEMSGSPQEEALEAEIVG